MKLVETVEILEFLMHMYCFPYSCRNHAAVLRELSTIKPLEKLAKLRDDWNELIERSSIEELAKCSEHKFLINYRSAQIPQLRISLS